jgi:hypothetical protein
MGMGNLVQGHIMSAADDALADALTAIGGSKEALRAGSIGMAIVHLVHANRYHVLARSGHALGATISVAFAANEAEVDRKLRALAEEVIAAAMK